MPIHDHLFQATCHVESLQKSNIQHYNQKEITPTDDNFSAVNNILTRNTQVSSYTIGHKTTKMTGLQVNKTTGSLQVCREDKYIFQCSGTADETTEITAAGN